MSLLHEVITPDTAHTVPPSLANNTWVVWVVAAVTILSILFTFIRKESGNWGQWLASQRRVAEERGDIVVGALKKDLVEMAQRGKDKDARIVLLENEVTKYRSERDALITYLRRWWNWALSGSVGSPPPVPEALSHLLPATSWKWEGGTSVTGESHSDVLNPPFTSEES